MPKYIDMTGQKFGALTCLRIDRERTTRGRTYWFFKCGCGSEVSIARDKMRVNPRTSCGCMTSNKGQFKTTHGMSKTPEYRAWRRILSYCLNPNTQHYLHYGGRGIKVCKSWENSFETFYEDVGIRPSPKHSIDRIDTDGDYEPSNVRWATQKEQVRNQRRTIFATLNGETRSLSEWCEVMGHKKSKIWSRMRKQGMTAEQALTSPPLR